MKNNFKKNIITWLLIFGTIIIFSSMFNQGIQNQNEIIFSDFLNKINTGEITSVEIKGEDINGKFTNGQEFYTLSADYPDLIKELREKNVEVKVVPIISTSGKIIAGLLGWLPFILLIGLWFYFMKGASNGANSPFKFGKSKAKLVQMKGKITFKDVAGIDEAKEELRELVDFLKEPLKYTKIGAKIPRGCLLVGEPGTGKTLLARAIAGEAEVPFFFISGSDFVEMFVGVGASRVRDMFEEAKKNAPCLIFIDEIDAVGRHRGIGIGGGNDEREQTLNQLLVEMDGFEGNEGIIVIAATNRPDVLDKALMRPGRFDRQITVALPDYRGREEILAVHAKKVQLASDVDLSVIAKATPGFSGADLANLINESALLTARANRKKITMQEVEEATDKIIMGLARKSRIMKPEDRKLTAYHEAGHTIVAMNCPHVDPLHKVTIISRGRAGGITSFLPEDDKNYEKKNQMLEEIMVAFGGRIAEEMILGKDNITGGASADIKYATRVAERMVTMYGFSEKLGEVNYEKKRTAGETYQLEGSSNETLKLIDSEIKEIITQQKEKAEKLLRSKKKDLIAVAEALLKHETLDKEQVEKVVKGISIEKSEEKVDYSEVKLSILNQTSASTVTDNKEKTEKGITKKIKNSKVKIEKPLKKVAEKPKTTKKEKKIKIKN
ncbi:MAG: ATP-dependent zinc metalloprotease FtsH [Rickettsiales bacterium]|nr:ATP-dependent zinc metalloprotease FtsH [Rickettsiales bacterium]